MICKFCGGAEFSTKYVMYVDAIVNKYGNFERLLSGEMSRDCELGDAKGPFKCLGCGAEYKSLQDGAENLNKGPAKDWNHELFDKTELVKPLKPGLVDVAYSVAVQMLKESYLVYRVFPDGKVEQVGGIPQLDYHFFNVFCRAAVHEKDYVDWVEKKSAGTK